MLWPLHLPAGLHMSCGCGLLGSPGCHCCTGTQTRTQATWQKQRRGSRPYLQPTRSPGLRQVAAADQNMTSNVMLLAVPDQATQREEENCCALQRLRCRCWPGAMGHAAAAAAAAAVGCRCMADLYLQPTGFGHELHLTGGALCSTPTLTPTQRPLWTMMTRRTRTTLTTLTCLALTICSTSCAPQFTLHGCSHRHAHAVAAGPACARSGCDAC